MTGTCERRLPPPRHEHTDERRPTLKPPRRVPHRRINESEHLPHAHTEQHCQLRAVSLPPQAVLPPPVVPFPHSPHCFSRAHESRASTEGGERALCRLSRSLWVTNKRLCVSLSHLFSFFLSLSSSFFFS